MQFIVARQQPVPQACHAWKSLSSFLLRCTIVLPDLFLLAFIYIFGYSNPPWCSCWWKPHPHCCNSPFLHTITIWLTIFGWYVVCLSITDQSVFALPNGVVDSCEGQTVGVALFLTSAAPNPILLRAAKYPSSNPRAHRDWNKLEAEVKVGGWSLVWMLINW
jgi:hypothetical protein